MFLYTSMFILRSCVIVNKVLNRSQLIERVNMTKGQRAGDGPIAVEVEKDKSYYWCSCGKSSKQPFCDGSHQGSEFTPVVYKAEEAKKVFFCACKQTNNQPLCDGSHSK
ncbi:iron-binding CDGSH zinc finger protein [Candidatus Pelagibacter ubique HIMB4]